MFRVVVVGGCAVDETYRATSHHISNNKMLGTSTPCRFLFRAPGGVGRNLADVLRKLLPEDFYSVQLISTVGNDSEADLIMKSCRDANIITRDIARLTEQTKISPTQRIFGTSSSFSSSSSLTTTTSSIDEDDEEFAPRPASTAKYVAILDGRGELATAAAAMTIFESKQFYDHIGRCKDQLLRASAVIIDTNLSALHFQHALTIAKQSTTSSSSSSSSSSKRFKMIAVDPISIEKGRRVVPVLMKKKKNIASSPVNFITIMKPNHFEAEAMAEEVLSRSRTDDTSSASISVSELKTALAKYLPRNFLMKTRSSLLDDDHNFGNNTTYSSSVAGLDGDDFPTAASDLTCGDQRNNNNNSSSSSSSGLRTLHAAARHAVVLMHTLELDIVMVSCGPNGSVVCFSSSSSATQTQNNQSNQSNQKNQQQQQQQFDADMELLDFTRHWQHVPLFENNENFYVRWFPAIRVRKVEKVTGAGDTHFGSFISHMLLSMTLPEEFSASTSAAADELHDDEITNDNNGKQDNNNISSTASSAKSQHLVWSELPVHIKGQLISRAVQHATTNASLALTTKKGATPKLVKLMLKSKM